MDRHIGHAGIDSQLAGDVTPTRISYADPDTAATPVSEWSDDGPEISTEAREHGFDTAGALARLGLAGSFDVDSPTDNQSISSFSALTIRESALSFESDTTTVHAPSVANSQNSSGIQASATSSRYPGMF